LKLSKAKEILELNLNMAGKKMPPDVKDALKLGVEALKFIKDNRHKCTRSVFDLLPNETPEGDPD